MKSGLYFLFPLVAIFFLAGLYPNLPEMVPSHFDFGGNPTDSQSKFGVFCILFIALGMTNLGLLLLSPPLIHKIPPELLNLPNKSYWISDPFRKAMMYSLMGRMGFVSSVLVNAIFMVVGLMIQNRGGETLSLILMGFILLLVGSILGFAFVGFKEIRPPKA